MSIDNVHHKVKLTSIMRDVRVYMGDGSPYDSGYDKLNHAYMYGGPEQATVRSTRTSVSIFRTT